MTQDTQDDFEQMMHNTLLYGMGLLIMEMKDGFMQTRVVPESEYKQLGEHLTNFPPSFNDK